LALVDCFRPLAPPARLDIAKSMAAIISGLMLARAAVRPVGMYFLSGACRPTQQLGRLGRWPEKKGHPGGWPALP
jgi:hypothetical protein